MQLHITSFPMSIAPNDAFERISGSDCIPPFPASDYIDNIATLKYLHLFYISITSTTSMLRTFPDGIG